MRVPCRLRLRMIQPLLTDHEIHPHQITSLTSKPKMTYYQNLRSVMIKHYTPIYKDSEL